MIDKVNRQWKLAARPVGMIEESDFQFADDQLASDQ
jgi:NADPH-dependent curcumin reductase CurA